VLPADPIQDEQQLLVLCRRLLRQNEDLHQHNKDLCARVDRLHGIVRWLGSEYRALRAEVDQAEQDHAVKDEAADVLFGAALDELASGTSGGQR
jgi:hypothetical protein